MGPLYDRPMAKSNAQLQAEHRARHPARVLAREKAWRQRNPEMVKAKGVRHRERNRRAALEKYGGACVRCGIEDWRLLVFDHINDDGHEMRGKVHPSGGTSLINWLRHNGYPEGIVQVLCHNCNALKQHHPESFHDASNA